MSNRIGHISHRILLDVPCVLQRFTGTINLAVLLDSSMELESSHGFQSQFPFLIDFRGAVFDLTPEDVLEFVATIRDTRFADQPRKSAYLIEGTHQEFMAKLYEYSRKHLPIEGKVCRTTEEMIEWTETNVHKNQILQSFVDMEREHLR